MIRERRILLLISILLLTAILLIACSNLPELPTRTPVAEAPAEADTSEEEAEGEAPEAQVEDAKEESEDDEGDSEGESETEHVSDSVGSGGAAKAVDLLGAWVDGGAPETDAFDYEGKDGSIYQGTFDGDILPLFTGKGVWYEGSRACDSCHFANSEASNHEMDLGTYAGIMAGGDVLSEPPGVPILGQSEVGDTDYDWEHAKLRARMRNNRMPPGFEFDVTEENRDGYCLNVSDDGVEVQEGEYGCDQTAVGLIAAWVDGGAPETDAFEYSDAQLTFERDVLPFFTENNMWFDGSQQCTGCHFGNTENSYHEMDLSSYAGIMAGGDVLSEPPGVPILGQSEVGATDYDWSHAKMKERLRDNRMPPGWEFDITEENRDGPYVLRGEPLTEEDMAEETMAGGAGTEATAFASSPTSTTTVTTIIITSPDGTTTSTTETVIVHYGEAGAAAEACAIHAVDLIANWVDAGSPETDAFDYTSVDDEACSGTFEGDVLPLFTENGLWFEGAQACTGCHFDNSENSYHEMDLSTYAGIMAGGDVLSEPPGVPILGQSEVGATDYDWSHAKLKERLRNNRMPPGWEFDITEENRDGPAVDVNGTEVRAVELIAAWVDAGAPETDAFGDYSATFEANVLPLFSENGAWFEGSQACTGCHFANSENSYHEMDLSTYEGIMAGGDVLSEPPGVPILGQSEVGATDYDWEHAKLKERLRNNRMPPGWEFDITEENRDGPLVAHGQLYDPTAVPAAAAGTTEAADTNECEITAVELIATWVDAGAPEMDAFDYTSAYDAACSGTFEVDILPLFTENGLWFEGAQACTGCHFDNSENSYHEMDLSSYAGIMAGGDVLSEPPGVPILGQSEVGATDYDWEHAKMKERLRNNRMPPGWEFDITEENRDGPAVDVNGAEVRAVELIAAWVDAGAPETDAFGDYGATFEANVLPLFTENGVWFDGAQACTGCHFANTENSYHEMDLSSYAGIMAGGDVLSEPPGVPILGQSEVGATDYDWEHAKLKERLRNNRMPPGWEFDITEENRDGPMVVHGQLAGAAAPSAAAAADAAGSGECDATAVDLIGAWVEAGAPEMDAFDYASLTDSACSGTFEVDILPLFTENGLWFDGAQACTGCHFDNSENSYHEMDLSTYEGIMAGGDVLSEPPGVPILGQSEVGATDYDWAHAKLRERLRNNRMPPGWEFDITEENRDGPAVDVNGAEVRAVDLIAAWVDAGAPETDAFGDYAATFEANVLPLFTENGLWFDGAQACTGCHFDNSENSYHEMDLSSYAGIMAGGDVLSEPPGVPILGQSEVGATDYDWEHAKLKERLRNNRMPPGWEFDITEENRDGPIVNQGQLAGAATSTAASTEAAGSGECEVTAVELIAAWVDAGAPEMDPFEFAALDESLCDGTFEADVLPLFTDNGVWFEGAQACTGCHFDNSENSYHEMDLSTYAGIMAGGDVLSEPPGVPILGQSEVGATDYDWEHAKMKERLRNNRMPPGWEFDITEENRDGPAVDVNGTEVRAVDLIAAWVDAGAPETDAFGDYAATFEANVLPLFTENGLWFEGAQACTGCHFDNSENSYHEMDLSSYAGIMAGGDVLSEPPGVPILGQSEVGATDYDWEHAKLKERLRNNRMPPGWEFDITEENRDGPTILAGTKQ